MGIFLLSWNILTGAAIPLLPAYAVGAAPSAAQQVEPAPPSNSVRRFDVDEYRVVGNTVLTETEIDNAVYGFLGPGKTIGDVEKARAALEQAYQKKGYPTVSAEIPVQRVVDGVVVLKVTERPVGRLRVTGSRYYDLGVIRSQAPSLAEGKVPNMQQVQHDVLALNQWPDRTVTPALRAGAAPDTVDVDLQVQDHLPLHASLELNNRQSTDTKPLRLNGTLSYDNLWQRGDSATFSYQVAPQRPSDATVFSGSYLFRIPGSNLSLLGSYLHSDSNVSTVGSTNVVGKGDQAGMRLLIPLGFGEGFVHTLSVGFDYKKFAQDVLFSGTTSNAPVTYYPATVSYQATLTGPRATTKLDASLVAAFGPGSNAAEFDNQRFGARPEFAYVRADVQRTQELPYRLEAYGHAGGQLAGAPLVSTEQQSLGGLDTVRGYLESEALGDYGGFVQAELRSPQLAERIGHRVNDLRFFVFFDAGTVGIHDPLPEQARAYTMSSTGVGLRARLLDYFNLEMEDAIPLENGPITRSGDNRILFRMSGNF